MKHAFSPCYRCEWAPAREHGLRLLSRDISQSPRNPDICKVKVCGELHLLRSTAVRKKQNVPLHHGDRILSRLRRSAQIQLRHPS